jgi:hypothetical protein
MWQENNSGRKRINISKLKLINFKTNSNIKVSETYIGVTVTLRMVTRLALVQ